jgi:hypothetical protein
LMGVEGRVLKSYMCGREKWGTWVLNQRSIMKNWWDFIERGGSIGDTVLLTRRL